MVLQGGHSAAGAAPGFSALSTAYLIGAPLVPKLLRTVRHESPAPVWYTLYILKFTCSWSGVGFAFISIPRRSHGLHGSI